MADPTIFTDEFNSTGGISLREAIRDTPSGRTIRLAAGMYQLSLLGVNEDSGVLGDLDLDGKTLTIEGIDDASTIIEWPTSISITDRDRLFHLFNGAQLTLRNVTLRNGYESAGGDGGGAIFIQDSSSKLILEASTLSGNAAPSEPGGAINSQGYFSITDSQFLNNIAPDGGAIYTNNLVSTNQIVSSTLSNNQAVNLRGGGILNAGRLNIDTTTIANNSSFGRGGGIYNGSFSDLTIQNSTISGNTASLGGGGISNARQLQINTTTISNNVSFSRGGGIYNDAPSNLTIQGSTVSGNSATVAGGGISNGGQATLRVDATTISNNSSAYGGGIYNSAPATGTTTIQNSTISGNAASSSGGGSFFRSPATITHSTIAFNRDTSGALSPIGGLALQNTAGVTLTLENSIVTNSVGGSDVGLTIGVGGSFIFNGRNIVKDGSVTNPSVLSVDPLLDPLQDNGGNIQTHALQNGSPAIDAAIGSTFTLDQRGFPRDTRPDLGAYEFSPIDTIAFFETAGATQAIEGLTDADVYAIRLSLQPSQPVTIQFALTDPALSLSTTSLSFTPTNWNTPQFVIVSIGDNRTNNGSRRSEITPTSTSDDRRFDGLPLSTIGVEITDNDTNPGTTRDLTDTPNRAIVIDTGDDIVTGSAARDFIISRDGDDLLFGLGGNDYLLGNDGNDGIAGGDGNDYLSGRFGDDYLSGGDGIDALYGGDGTDLLYGGGGDDLLSGGDGDDQLYGGFGIDTLIGGLGRDIYSLDTQSIDRIQGFTSSDRLQLLDGSGFGDVAIEVGSGELSGATVIRIRSRNQIVAALDNISPSLITSANFFTS